MLVYSKTNKRRTRAFQGHNVHYIGPALDHYRCYKLSEAELKATVISDTVDLRHHYLTQPLVTAANPITREINFISCELREAPAIYHSAQLESISSLK